MHSDLRLSLEQFDSENLSNSLSLSVSDYKNKRQTY